MVPLSVARRQTQAGGMRSAQVASRPRDEAAARHTIIYASPGGQSLGVRPYRITDKVAARALGASLDRQLARGREPEEGRLLAARAQDIVAPRRREQLARYWEQRL